MITVTNYGPVRELRLNRPPVNALSTELISALRKAIEQAPVVALSLRFLPSDEQSGS
jgi:enoyl-CoA hydratase/carnithine racemase